MNIAMALLFQATAFLLASRSQFVMCIALILALRIALPGQGIRTTKVCYKGGINRAQRRKELAMSRRRG